jgi:hypothetical protein
MSAQRDKWASGGGNYVILTSVDRANILMHHDLGPKMTKVSEIRAHSLLVVNKQAGSSNMHLRNPIYNRMALLATRLVAGRIIIIKNGNIAHFTGRERSAEQGLWRAREINKWGMQRALRITTEGERKRETDLQNCCSPTNTQIIAFCSLRFMRLESARLWSHCIMLPLLTCCLYLPFLVIEANRSVGQCSRVILHLFFLWLTVMELN